MPDGFEVYFNGIIGGTASGRRFVRNETRKADSPGIDTIFFKIIIAEQFTGNFGYPINGRRVLGCILRGFSF
jgi:hypothetical protein